ncbi:TlpA disulfide reductase family protein [Kingella kingae]|uniref:TlpA disulfide reductase family protein n=1 Tax=Kingella kingae TaxID=504 RepID=UPI0002F9C553|nr:TlpA disulfide reductase family protein [Kingella kingae]MDK4555918.1 TlpA disulfide reductase family protein [Kingella kingae]MDK4574881.1 TlpA disulfide reductase family protein [Kingella kingae]MDK4584806.1 TlpA disulfide reductase family protein [Kingella kingae]MDK4588734.1 TlpA disulfide reductase family protein [Kingella kingae]MDK4596485.1 TlpA disulfide reductase family protein [Kingella kingae]
MKKIGVVAVVLLIIGLIGFTLKPSYPAAPAFSLPDLQGKVVDNSSLNNRVTLINFWFPSCPGCVTEMPKLIQMAKDYQGKDFQILGIAVPVDAEAAVREYAQQRQLPFTVMFDAQKTATQSFIKTELYPTSVLINKRGEILQTFVGEPNFADLYKTVDTELVK